MSKKLWIDSLNCRRLICGVLLVLVASSVSAAEEIVSRPDLGESSIGWQPYNVHLMVAFDSTRFDRPRSEVLLNEIQSVANRSVGQVWRLSIAETQHVFPVSERSLRQFNQLPQSVFELAPVPDVCFLATVEPIPAGVQIAVRSWQPELRLKSEVASVELADLRDVPESLVGLCSTLFRPTALIEQVEGQSVRMRLHSGELRAADPAFTQLKKQDLLIPMLIFRDKSLNVERVQVIPWTYVSVDEVDGLTVSGTVQSGLKLPLNGKRRNRVDTLFVTARPQFPSTQIQLLTQSASPIVLSGHRIEVRSEPTQPRPLKDGHGDHLPQTLLVELLTDRRGQTNVTPVPDVPLVWLFVYSGDQLLARVPVIPGLESHMKLQVPDDATRLMAEADLQMLQGEVVDAVALRNTAFATIRAAAKRDDWKTVNQKIALLKARPDTASLSDRLNAVRVVAVAAAKRRKDRATEVRINRICDDTAVLIRAHLSEEKVRLLIEEMEALQAKDTVKEPGQG